MHSLCPSLTQPVSTPSSQRAERKSRSPRRALSKTDVMILRLLQCPMNASSAPWSSPPSLTALHRLALRRVRRRAARHLSSSLQADGGRAAYVTPAQTYIALEAMGMRPIPKTPPPQDGADDDGTVAVGFPYQGGWEAIDPAQMPSPQLGLGDSMRFTASQCVRQPHHLRKPQLCVSRCVSHFFSGSKQRVGAAARERG